MNVTKYARNSSSLTVMKLLFPYFGTGTYPARDVTSSRHWNRLTLTWVLWWKKWILRAISFPARYHLLLYEKQRRFEFDNHQTRGTGLYSCLRVTLPPPPHLLPIASLAFLVAKLCQESGIYLPLSFYRAITRICLCGRSEQCQKSPKSGTSAFLIIHRDVTPNSALAHPWCSLMPN